MGFGRCGRARLAVFFASTPSHGLGQIHTRSQCGHRSRVRLHGAEDFQHNDTVVCVHVGPPHFSLPLASSRIRPNRLCRYQLAFRTAQAVAKDLTDAGVPNDVATKLSEVLTGGVARC